MGRPKGSKNNALKDIDSNTAVMEIPKTDIPADAGIKEIKKNVVSEEVSTSDGEYTLEITRDYYGNIDPFYLSKKDPNYQYRFLRADDKNLSIKTGNLLFQKGGWQLCQRKHLEKLGIHERFISPDGLYRKGDTVLAFMPKELYQEKENEKKRQADYPIKNIQRFLKEGDPTKGGKEIHGTMKGLQTAKSLGLE